VPWITAKGNAVEGLCLRSKQNEFYLIFWVKFVQLFWVWVFAFSHPPSPITNIETSTRRGRRGPLPFCDALEGQMINVLAKPWNEWSMATHLCVAKGKQAQFPGAKQRAKKTSQAQRPKITTNLEWDGGWRVGDSRFFLWSRRRNTSTA